MTQKKFFEISPKHKKREKKIERICDRRQKSGQVASYLSDPVTLNGKKEETTLQT